MEKILLESLDSNKNAEMTPEDAEMTPDSNLCEIHSPNDESGFTDEKIQNRINNEMPNLCCDSIRCFESRGPMTRFRLIKNLAVMSCAFVLYDIAFVGTSILQSTMNSVDEIGVKALISSNVGFMVSVMLLPTLLIKHFGCKFNMVVSIFVSSTYIAANFYPHLGTFIPAALASGIAESIIWASNSIYLTQTGFLYTSHVKDSAEKNVAKSFGVFNLFLQSAQIWCSLISYYVLKPDVEVSYGVSNQTLLSCGANFCNQDPPNDTNPNLEPPSYEKRYLMTAIFVSCSLGSALTIALFLDPLDKEHEKQDKKYSGVLDLLMASLKLHRDKKQILFLPITIHLGMQRGLYTVMFTEAFVACVWGVHHVGYVAICFGIFSTSISGICGLMAKWLSRSSLILFAATGNAINYICMLLWTPSDDHVVLFALAGVWGFADAIWWVILAAAYGVNFENDQEAAFSNFYFWNTIGFLVVYICSNYLCVSVTLYITLSVVFVGIIGYLAVELPSFCGKKCQYDVGKGG